MPHFVDELNSPLMSSVTMGIAILATSIIEDSLPPFQNCSIENFNFVGMYLMSSPYVPRIPEFWYPSWAGDDSIQVSLSGQLTWLLDE